MTSKQELKEAAVDISNELRQLQIRMIFVSATIDSWIAGIEETFL